MPLTSRQSFAPTYFECDPWDRMTPGAVLRRVQEISTDQCEGLGIDPAFYARTHTAFMLSRMSLRCWRMPVAKQAVAIETRAYGMRRAVYHRVTSLYDAAGEKLCETDTRWVLIDTDTRRILRRPLPEFVQYFNEEPGAEEHDLRLPKAAITQPVAQREAALSLCDRNLHINNTRYADLMCDCLPAERLQAAPPRRMLFFYHNEIPLGAGFDIRTAPVENGTYFLVSTGEGKNFEGFVTFDD